MNIRNGSVQIFRLWGIDVYLHYSWALIAAFQIYRAKDNLGLFSGHAQPIPYHILVYLCLFLIVLIHEFGHALACKSVGGIANQIILWPLGGIAYVNPPQRAGAMLWSIAAGPLVNVILLPLTIIPLVLLRAGGMLGGVGADLLYDVAAINAVLLFFNMLPIYPMDGGQILRSLLWFICGRGLSLIIAAAIGLAGGAVLVALALYSGSLWLAVVVGFMLTQSYQGFKQGQLIRRLEKSPRHMEVRCPMCLENPPAAPMWGCRCGAAFDTFAVGGRCPGCGAQFQSTTCTFCGKSSPFSMWYATKGFPVTGTVHPVELPNV